MSAKDLIPLNKRTKEEALAIQRKGGLTCSPKRALAAQIRWLKQKGYNSSTINKMIEIMENPHCSSFNIISIIEEFKEAAKKEAENKDREITAKDYYLMNKMYLDLHKVVHGEKHKVEHTGDVGLIIDDINKAYKDD